MCAVGRWGLVFRFHVFLEQPLRGERFKYKIVPFFGRWKPYKALYIQKFWWRFIPCRVQWFGCVGSSVGFYGCLVSFCDAFLVFRFSTGIFVVLFLSGLFKENALKKAFFFEI